MKTAMPTSLKRWGATNDLLSTRMAKRQNPVSGDEKRERDRKLGEHYEGEEKWEKAAEIWDRLGDKKRAAECRRFAAEEKR